MIMLNIGSKYIKIDLTKSQERFLKHNVARQVLIFSIIWMGTKDVVIALTMTAVFHVLANHLLNEQSSLCIIPHSMRQFMHLIDEDGDGMKYLYHVFHNEKEYPFLEKIFDSKLEGFKYHVKFFKIDHDAFNKYYGDIP